MIHECRNTGTPIEFFPMRWESMIVQASCGITSRFISQNKSGQMRRLNPNSRAAPWCASSRERERHWRLFIQR
jgi:hypothetical protein